MFFLFGWQPKTKDEGPVVEGPCRQCDEPDAAWHLYTVTMWISLFLMPILPTAAEHWLRCRRCGDGIHLHPEQNALIRAGDPKDDPTILQWLASYQRGARPPAAPAAGTGEPPDDRAS